MSVYSALRCSEESCCSQSPCSGALQTLAKPRSPLPHCTALPSSLLLASACSCYATPSSRSRPWPRLHGGPQFIVGSIVVERVRERGEFGLGHWMRAIRCSVDS
ncbi:hypothetical protein KC19_12G116900 [Ceratodon purpureus]|uniref:Uncharacterized protein n=1 Tax=Ceratodon purpureus TaxID=3225 RepID=A0A8T0G688_CERPU|nr:hypothetical protein KC19_12G116900 [Ceratodon purpureus]